MRIIGGKLKGRRFEMPNKNWKTRPTTDQAKESLFNILNNQFDFTNLEVLELFAGTGNIGYEFASRGANVTFVEKYGPCIDFIRNQCLIFDIVTQTEYRKSDVFKFVQESDETFNLIFADPPYALKRMKILPDLIFKSTLLEKKGQLIIEHDSHTSFEENERFIAFRKYGQSYFSFFK